MTQTDMIWRFTVNVLGGTSDDEGDAAEALEAHLDDLTEELLKLEKCNPEFHDPSIGGSLASGEVEIEFTIDATEEKAVALAKPIIRAAIHAAGGFTPRWDDDDHQPVHKVEYQPGPLELAGA